MVMNCEEVWREVSNYLDDDLAPELRQEMERHLAHCRKCAAIVDGAHNIIALIADDRVFPLPKGFSARLRDRIRRELQGPRGTSD